MTWIPEQRLQITNQVRNELIINCIIVFITLLVVVLRVVGRVYGPGLGWDDLMVMLAMPMGIAMLACQGVFATTGSGYNLAEHPELIANVPWILQVSFGMQPVYIALLALCKASMLFFFLRIFPTKFMVYTSKIALVVVLLWAVAFIFTSIFLCTPISAQWTGMGKCGEYIPFIQSIIATNAAGDLIIMAMPMQSLWQLQKRTQEKLAIMLCFSLASACIVCAIFRIVYISTVDLKMNVTGTMPTTILLFILEPNLAILCVSIPMLRPFFTRVRRQLGLTSDGGGYSYGSATGQSKRLTSQNGEWELKNYVPKGKAGSHDIEVARVDDDCSSERNLTAPTATRDEIRVETTWAVRHEEEKR